MVVVITKGSQAKNSHMPSIVPGEKRIFAHRWDPDCTEDRAHRIRNFVIYAQMLGGFDGLQVLRPNPMPEDAREAQQVEVDISEFSTNVRSILHSPVEIQ